MGKFLTSEAFRGLALLAVVAGMLAAVLMLADTAGAADDPPRPPAIKVNMACSPLTTAQKPAGTTQTCLIRVINSGDLAAEDLEAHKQGGWTVTGVSAYAKLPVSGGSITSYAGVECDGNGEPSCSIESLPGGGRFYVVVDAVKPVAQDGFSKTKACAAATGIAQKCALEAASLP